MIRHVFMYKVAKTADAQVITNVLNELPRKVPGIRFWQLGKHAGAPDNSGDPWDCVLIADFESWEGLATYSDHPFHREVVERLLPMFSARAVCDFEYEGR